MDRIELRSEKVRKIIGGMPSGFIRYGISIITFILILSLVILYYTPYKESKNIFDYLIDSIK